MTQKEQITDLQGQIDSLEKKLKELAEKPVTKEPDKFQDKVLNTDGELTHLYLGGELLPIATGEVGDMTKAVYDTGDNGKVDAADDADKLEGSTKTQVQDHTPKSHALNSHTVPTADMSMDSHKLISVSDPTSNQDVATKKYVDDNIAPVGAGDSLKASADTARSWGTNTYTKKKEITVGRSGTLRIKYDQQTTDLDYVAYARVYRNGAAVGTEHTTNTTGSWVERSQDIAGWTQGDKCQLYIKTDVYEMASAKCQNFRIYTDEWSVDLD